MRIDDGNTGENPRYAGVFGADGGKTDGTLSWPSAPERRRRPTSFGEHGKSRSACKQARRIMANRADARAL